MRSFTTGRTLSTHCIPQIPRSSNSFLTFRPPTVPVLRNRQTVSMSSTTMTEPTPSLISLTPTTLGVCSFAPQITPQSCKRASTLLQKDMNDHHVFFNKSGFHNHIPHHLFTIFALGASDTEIQKAYDDNADYQRPQFPIEQRVVQSMQDPEQFKSFLSKERYYHDYEDFFRKEMEQAEADGGHWTDVVSKHLFARTPHSERLFALLFAGFFHPFIHFGFGVEFQQPAMVVEALAQTAVHEPKMNRFLLETEKAAEELKSADTRDGPRSLVSLIHEARSNPTIRDSARSSDANKLHDGVFTRAFPEITSLASQFYIPPSSSSPDDLRRTTAELINTAAYFASAAQHASHAKTPKFDFFYMHCVNSSIFLTTLVHQPWIPVEFKVRVLEWKARVDLAMYVSRGCPELFPDEVRDYVPQARGGWDGVVRRVRALKDDGHASKLVRALKHGEDACREFEEEEDMRERLLIRGDMWLKAAHMAVDSVEAGRPTWIRNAGFEEAWKDVPERKKRNAGL